MLFRDVLQFVVMLFLVRLLNQADYGRMAIAQSILMLLSVVSFSRFLSHAIQLRDPKTVDWQAHFTAGTVLNCGLFVVALGVAGALSLIEKFSAVALPLAILALSLLLDIPANIRHRMLQVEHDWRRLNALLGAGLLLSSMVAIAVAAAGGGVWALVLQPLLYNVPTLMEFARTQSWRPDWSWSWARYRSTIDFASTRIVIAALSTGRGFAEQSSVAAVYDLSMVGILSRANGLATLMAGRLGTLSVGAIYPVLTRAEPGSAQFNRNATLVLVGVCWSTVAAAAALGVMASDVVALLYGSGWSEVDKILPLAAFGIAANGILATITSLILANNSVKTCFYVDLLTTLLGVAIVFLLIPQGVQTYLLGVAALGTVMVLIGFAVLRHCGIVDLAGIVRAIVPALVAAAIAIGAVILARRAIGPDHWIVVRLVYETTIYSGTFVLVLRCAYSGPLAELVAVLPFSGQLERALFLKAPPTSQ